MTGDLFRRRHILFFPPPFELDDSGVGIPKDTLNCLLWLATGEAIQIGESSSFRHAPICITFFKELSSVKAAVGAVIVNFRVYFYPLDLQKTLFY